MKRHERKRRRRKQVKSSKLLCVCAYCVYLLLVVRTRLMNEWISSASVRSDRRILYFILPLRLVGHSRSVGVCVCARFACIEISNIFFVDLAISCLFNIDVRFKWIEWMNEWIGCVFKEKLMRGGQCQHSNPVSQSANLPTEHLHKNKLISLHNGCPFDWTILIKFWNFIAFARRSVRHSADECLSRERSRRICVVTEKSVRSKQWPHSSKLMQTAFTHNAFSDLMAFRRLCKHTYTIAEKKNVFLHENGKCNWIRVLCVLSLLLISNLIKIKCSCCCFQFEAVGPRLWMCWISSSLFVCYDVLFSFHFGQVSRILIDAICVSH